jgi:Serine-threonine protein kinase 19
MTLSNKSNTTGKNPPKLTETKIKVVVKRRRQSKPKTFKNSSKKGLPNLTKEVTDAPPDDNEEKGENDDVDDEFGFPPLEDAIPCDTLLAFQALTQSSETSPQLSVHIPLQTSMEAIPCALESQIVPVLQQNEQDQDSFAMVAEELPDLIRKNTLRRMSSISTPGTNTELTVLLLTSDYIRGVWDAHDITDTTSDTTSPEQRELQRAYVEWFVNHLHCWTGRLLLESKLQRTWNRRPPNPNLPYALGTSLFKALEYLQKIQVILAHNHAAREATYQLLLPQWGTVVSAVQKAQTKMVRKLQQTYQKEVSEKTFLQQPFYHGVSTRFLLQLMQDTGKVHIVPKPFGKFIKLAQPKTKSEGKMKK